MVGIVGYLLNETISKDGPLQSMTDEVMRFPFHLKDEYRCELLHVARVHLGTYGPATQPVFSEDGQMGIVGEGMTYPTGDGMASPVRTGDNGSGTWLGSTLLSFRERGVDGLKELNGSFSVVMFDRKDEAVHLVSDRFGTRPIYYWAKENDFAFASEAKAILKHSSYRKKFNADAAGKFFRYGKLGVWGDDTWFEGIRVLAPGSILTAKRGETRLLQYWDVDYSPRVEGNVDSIGDSLALAFRRAVTRRTSDRALRYSVALSGGLDSRVVLAASPGEVTAYTFGMRGSHELAIASRVASTRGTMHLVCAFDPDESAKYAEEVIELSDGMELVGLAFLLLADKRFRGALDVSLDGFALDLTLGGSFLRKNIMEAESVPVLAGILDRKFTLFKEEELESLLYPEFLELLGRSAERSFLSLISQSKGSTMADKADYFALKTRVRSFTIMGHILTRNYFEDTIPTYDNEFMDLVTGIPAGLRYHYKVYKKFLRKLSSELSDIPYERIGLSPNRPQAAWMAGIILAKTFATIDKLLCRATKGRVVRFDFNGYMDHASALRASRPWKELTAITLANQDSCMYRYRMVRREYVLRLVHDHMSGRRDNREKIHYLITFELMLRRFFPDGIGA